MKNLIASFFIFTAVVAVAQTEQPDVVADNQKRQAQKVSVVKPALPEPIKPMTVTSVKTNILTGFSTGNAKILSEAFPSNLNISIMGKANLYSKPQAEQVLTTFFSQHKVSTFTIEHEGNSNGTKYFIGTYVSEKKKYRVTVNVKSVKGVESIKSITIER